MSRSRHNVRITRRVLERRDRILSSIPGAIRLVIRRYHYIEGSSTFHEEIKGITFVPWTCVLMDDSRMATSSTNGTRRVFKASQITLIQRDKEAFLTFHRRFFRFTNFQFLRSACFDYRALSTYHSRDSHYRVFNVRVTQGGLHQGLLQSCAWFFASVLLRR